MLKRSTMTKKKSEVRRVDGPRGLKPGSRRLTLGLIL